MRRVCQISLPKVTARTFSAANTLQIASVWKNVTMGPPDPILGLTVAFREDTAETKLNLGVGAYRTNEGKPFLLQSVKKAEEALLARSENHEYAPIGGEAQFQKLTAELLFGADCKPLKEGRIASIQTLSGTGALRVAGDFMKRFLPNASIYIPSPSWGNHTPIFRDAGFKVQSYSYYDGKGGLNFEGMKKDLNAAENGSLILLHTCAHNPTGIDPTEAQWRELSQVIKAKNHFVLFDSAYQGFASGDPTKDSYAVRHFVEQGHLVGVCQSFAKNMGLYGERVGALHFVVESSQKKAELLSQLLILVRPMYSNPPIHGAKIVTEVLGDANLNALWRQEVKGMADRIISMRSALVAELKKIGSTKNWSHIASQIGMFCFSGLSEEQVKTLKEKWHVYMTKDGRISMAGVTTGNIPYLAKAIHDVSK